MLAKDTVEVRSNLFITARERGKIVDRYAGHNIWLDIGRQYLAELIGYSAYVGAYPTATGTPFRSDRVQYMCLGIGSTAQNSPAIADNAPMSTKYPGGHVYTDTDATLVSMERPVRIAGSENDYSTALPTDQWLAQVNPVLPSGLATEVTFIRTFTGAEVSYGSFTVVPVSEIGLFTSGASPLVAPGPAAAGAYTPYFVAYDTFATISKTNAIDLEVVWAVKF